jgi:hypothetical protein
MSINDIRECNGVINRSGGNISVNNSDPAKSKACVEAIERLVVSDDHMMDLQVEYKRLKKAYTPLNLLMERARTIPLESVWPGRVGGSSFAYPQKSDLKEFVQNEVDRQLRNAGAGGGAGAGGSGGASGCAWMRGETTK